MRVLHHEARVYRFPAGSAFARSRTKQARDALMTRPGNARGCRLTLAEFSALVAATAVGLALDLAYAPALFSRTTSNLGDRLAILAIIATPCVALGAVTLILMRTRLPRLGWRPPARLGMSLVAPGMTLIAVIGLMRLVMRMVVGLAE